MVHEKTNYTKEDLFTAIQKICNYLKKKYYFKLLKFLPERTKAIIKDRGECD